MGEESMIEALQLLNSSTLKNKTQRLRDLYEYVKKLKDSGFTHARIVETMKEQHLVFPSVQAFEVTFYRVAKERSKKQCNPVSPELMIEIPQAFESERKIPQSQTDGSTVGLSIVEADIRQRINVYPPRSKILKD